MRVRKLFEAGERSAEKLKAAGREEIAGEKAARLDHFEVVNLESLDPVEKVGNGVLVAVAAFVGATRLIDNILL
jgi:pantoate--beta-alanine ligase